MTTGAIVRRPVEAPPTSWIDDMRTPPADIILQEFHRQKYCTDEAMAEGQENASPNTGAVDMPDTGQSLDTLPRLVFAGHVAIQHAHAKKDLTDLSACGCQQSYLYRVMCCKLHVV